MRDNAASSCGAAVSAGAWAACVSPGLSQVLVAAIASALLAPIGAAIARILVKRFGGSDEG